MGVPIATIDLCRLWSVSVQGCRFVTASILSILQFCSLNTEAFHCMIAMDHCQLDKYESAPSTLSTKHMACAPGMVKCYTQRVNFPKMLSSLESKVRRDQFSRRFRIWDAFALQTGHTNRCFSQEC